MMGKGPNLDAIRDWCKSKFQPIGNYAAASDIPTQTSRLTNDSGYLTETGDSSNTTVTFEQAAERANVQPGDDLATAFAKLSRYCADLKNVAFTAAYEDLTGAPIALRNPYPLTFSGAAQGTYYGDIPVDINIPIPVFPAIGNGTVTVSKNGTSLGNFGLNDTFDTEVNIDVPTIANNLLATEPGTALDAVQGKTLDNKINNLNPLKQYYDVGVSGNIDSHLDSLAFLQEHPGGIFGHSVALQHIVGYWVNIISYGARTYGQVSQVAFGVRGTAVRYLSHETNKWSEWVPFNDLLIDRIDQIENDLSANIKTETWLPSNGYDPLSENSKMSIYSVNPNIIPAQGLPSSFNKYGTIIVFGGTMYKTMIYISLMGEFAVYSTNKNSWEW